MYNAYQNYPYTNYAAPNYFNQPQFQAQQPQQVMRQVQPQQAQYEMPIQDIRFVTSEEAKAYIVMPNTKVLLIDRQNGMAHLKTADNMGQSVTQCFKFNAVNADGTPIKEQSPQPQINLDEFIKKSDISALGFVTVEQYNSLAQKLEQLQKQISGGKQNGATSKQAT